MGKRKPDPPPPELDFAYAFFLSENGDATYDWMAGPFTQVTGHPSGTLRQRNWNELIYTKNKPLLEDRIKILQSGRGDSREYRILTADGHLRWVRDHAQPVRTQPHGDLLAPRPRDEPLLRQQAGSPEISASPVNRAPRKDCPQNPAGHLKYARSHSAYNIGRVRFASSARKVTYQERYACSSNCS